MHFFIDCPFLFRHGIFGNCAIEFVSKDMSVYRLKGACYLSRRRFPETYPVTFWYWQKRHITSGMNFDHLCISLIMERYCKEGSGSSCIPILVWIAFCARSFSPISFTIACPCKVLIHAETEIGKFLSKRNIGSCAFCFLDFQIKSIGRGDSFHDREGMDLMIGSFESCNAHSCFPWVDHSPAALDRMNSSAERASSKIVI